MLELRPKGKFIVPNSQKSYEDGPKYTTYNGTCGNGGGSGTPDAYQPLPLSVSRSCDGTQGARYHQTTGKTRKSWGGVKRIGRGQLDLKAPKGPSTQDPHKPQANSTSAFFHV